MKKRGLLLLFLVVLLLLFLFLFGCFKKTTIITCDSPNVIIGERCCADNNNNTQCDDAELRQNMSTPGVCGNNACENESGENCTTCWKDCGACKRIVYIYVPRNFTLAEITYDLNSMTRDGIKFRKDINALNNVSNFFYFNKPVPRHIAEFMGRNYELLKDSRWILLNDIMLENYYVNDSASLISYVNFSNWYITHGLLSDEVADYEARISTGNAKKDYPTQPTGWQKEFRYEEWDFRNYTKHEQVLYDHVKPIDNSTAESVYASITTYNITYKYHEFAEMDEGIKEAFNSVEEKRLAYIHSLSVACARNLVITVYDYDYSTIQYSGMTSSTIDEQVLRNRADLMRFSEGIKAVCREKYANKVFTYS